MTHRLLGTKGPCQSLLAHKFPFMGPERTVEMVITVSEKLMR